MYKGLHLTIPSYLLGAHTKPLETHFDAIM
jgi:hypothetical protein